MRIIAGYLGGLSFESPRNQRTHPMADKVRGALFNSLGDLSGLTVLDAFTGSGALAYEALSRGAVSVTALDIDKGAVTTVAKNSEALGLKTKLEAIRVNAKSWSARNSQKLFDVVLCDPPYDDVDPSLLRRIAAHAKPDGTVVISLSPKVSFLLPDTGFRQLTAKSYGDAQLVFYRRIS